MDLNTLRDERKKWLTWKNIIPYQEAIKVLKT
jgi:tRNA (mo5U34)-methyltransferase